MASSPKTVRWSTRRLKLPAIYSSRFSGRRGLPSKTIIKLGENKALQKKGPGGGCYTCQHVPGYICGDRSFYDARVSLIVGYEVLILAGEGGTEERVSKNCGSKLS